MSTHVYDDGDVTNWFSISTDCVKSLSNMIGAMVYRNGGIRPFETAAALVVGNDSGVSCGQYCWGINRIGRAVRSGIIVTDKKVLTDSDIPADVSILINRGDNFPEYHGWRTVLNVRDGNSDRMQDILKLMPYGLEPHLAKQGIVQTSNGQFYINTKKSLMQICTESCEAAVVPVGEKIQGAFLGFENISGWTSVMAAIPRDGMLLRNSRRILIFHLTDTQACGTEFDKPDLEYFKSWGAIPHMAAAGEADITFPCHGEATLYALDTAGERIGEVPLVQTGGIIKARLSVFNPFGQTMVYELEMNKGL